MEAITRAVELLQQVLKGNIPDEPGVCTFSVPVERQDESASLAWLGSQPYYPQFYWQQRSGRERVAALGAVRQFSSLAQAEAFLHTSAHVPQIRICGLNAFDPHEGFLFLPRLEWWHRDGASGLRLNLSSDTSLYDDAQTAMHWLETLQIGREIPALTLSTPSVSHLPEKNAWLALIRHATEGIARGDMDKVVLARATDLHYNQPVMATSVMAASRKVNTRCYHFYLAFDARRAFLGSSPERLFQRKGAMLRTEALAGTVASDDDDVRAKALADWLHHDDKNQRENQWVVDDICRRLAPIAHDLNVLPSTILRLRKVQHIQRRIQAVLKHPTDTQCLVQLQPTAAVAGLPRERARDFIACHEPFARQWYAGSAGYLSLAAAEFCVSLRSAWIEASTVRLYAGAGIVAGSDPEDEWQEIENKAAGLRTLLA